MRNQNIYRARKGGLPTVTQLWEQRIMRHMKKMEARARRRQAARFAAVNRLSLV